MDKTNVLAFCYNTIPSAIIGVIRPLQYLQDKNLVNLVYKESMRVTNEDIKMADVIISIRGAEALDVRNITTAKSMGKYIVYYLDDDLLNIGELSRTYNKIYFQREDVKSNIINIMKTSNCLWTTNSNIADRYNNYFKKVSVTGAPAILLEHNKKTKVKKDNNLITIGFAGGYDHVFFLEKMLLKPFYNILDKYKDKVRIEICGLKSNVFRNKGIRFFPYMRNFDEYINFMISKEWDIAVAPLKDSKFHSCKYFNKFLEYGAINAAGIYSNVEPFTYIVNNNENGMLVNNTVLDWTNSLITLIEDENKRNKIIKNAYDLLKRDFNVNKIAYYIMKVIPELVNYKSQ